MAAEWIFIQRALHCCGQIIETPPHVGNPGRQPHPGSWGQTDNSNASTKPRSRSAVTSPLSTIDPLRKRSSSQEIGSKAAPERLESGSCDAADTVTGNSVSAGVAGFTGSPSKPCWYSRRHFPSRLE